MKNTAPPYNTIASPAAVKSPPPGHRRQRNIPSMLLLAALAVAIVFSFVASPVLMNAEYHALQRNAYSTIDTNAPSIAHALATQVLQLEGVPPDSTAAYAAQAATTGLDLDRCRTHSENRYITTMTCDIAVTLHQPSKVSINGTYLVTMERKSGHT